MSDPGLTIDVFSDVICPWCYIGKRRLDQALNQLKGAAGSASVTWRPFQLNPIMPKEGMDRVAYLEAKFGSVDTFRRMEEHVLAAGEAERIPFAFEKVARTPNTFLAHRLIWYAERQGRQDAVVESLFLGYFVEGEDIGSVAVLIRLAERAALNGAAVHRMLTSHEGEAEVHEQEAEGRRLGIRGVPYFVVNQAYGISGAQPAEVFASAIERAQAHFTEPSSGGR
jgi:predicted DsbA family dithiol-disulfide isomerase